MQESALINRLQQRRKTEYTQQRKSAKLDTDTHPHSARAPDVPPLMQLHELELSMRTPHNAHDACVRTPLEAFKAL
eukprot:50633-Eustigmatos_ZCMA.PRE.1